MTGVIPHHSWMTITAGDDTLPATSPGRPSPKVMRSMSWVKARAARSGQPSSSSNRWGAGWRASPLPPTPDASPSRCRYTATLRVTVRDPRRAPGRSQHRALGGTPRVWSVCHPAPRAPVVRLVARPLTPGRERARRALAARIRVRNDSAGRDGGRLVWAACGRQWRGGVSVCPPRILPLHAAAAALPAAPALTTHARARACPRTGGRQAALTCALRRRGPASAYAAA